MPKRAMVPCRRRCGRLVEMGICAACAANRPALAVRESAAKRGYGAPWRKERKAHLAKHPFCVDPYSVHGEVLVLATNVDHIIPHKGNYKLFHDPKNRQGLCASCHSRKTATEDGGFGR